MFQKNNVSYIYLYLIDITSFPYITGKTLGEQDEYNAEKKTGTGDSDACDGSTVAMEW
jgi:hypothetical protein